MIRTIREEGERLPSESYLFTCLVSDAEDLLLEDEKPHVLASTLKLFFRQLPSPLICEEFYEDFIRSTSKSQVITISNFIGSSITHAIIVLALGIDSMTSMSQKRLDGGLWVVHFLFLPPLRAFPDFAFRHRCF